MLKHTALVAVLRHLRTKETPFAVIDTHAGRAIYDLGGSEAGRTGEAGDGIGRLSSAKAPPPFLDDYLGLVSEFGPARYPGSPLIAAKLLREQDRLIAIERHPEECAALAASLRRFPRARAIEGDGYAELLKLLPPPERRAAVLIDPPYESEDEFRAAARALIAAHRRFATGIYILWYPIKGRGEAEAAAGELLNAGIARLLRVELDVGVAPGEAPGQRLSATGLLVANAPYGFSAGMESVAVFLARVLGRGAGALGRVEHLAGAS